MGYFARVNNGVVEQVISASQDFIDSYVSTEPGEWVKTSYNTRGGKHYKEDNTESDDQSKAFRKNYPSIGWSYDSTIDGFIPPKPEGMTSWIINTTTGHWEAPIAYPTIDTYNDGNKDRPYTISWDEPNVRWVATDKADPVGNWRWDATSLAWVSI